LAGLFYWFWVLLFLGDLEKSHISPISSRKSVAATCFTLTHADQMGIFKAPIIGSPLYRLPVLSLSCRAILFLFRNP
jgi:hypothetical protein